MAFLHPETVSQNSRPEWDAVSACDSVGKARPTPITNTGSHFPPKDSTGKCIPFRSQIPGWTFQNPAHPESPSRSEYIRAWNIRLLGLPSIKGRPRVTKKASRISGLSRLYYFERTAATAYSPSTAFLAAAAMLSRSSLVGWSFAATQLSSSILNRALSGSCSSMAS